MEAYDILENEIKDEGGLYYIECKRQIRNYNRFVLLKRGSPADTLDKFINKMKKKDQEEGKQYEPMFIFKNKPSLDDSMISAIPLIKWWRR